jgi:hypothetical protein
LARIKKINNTLELHGKVLLDIGKKYLRIWNTMELGHGHNIDMLPCKTGKDTERFGIGLRIA